MTHVAIAHAPLVQWDGCIVKSCTFVDAFLSTDCIGTRWCWYDMAMRVGNSDFSLRWRNEGPRLHSLASGIR